MSGRWFKDGDPTNVKIVEVPREDVNDDIRVVPQHQNKYLKRRDDDLDEIEQALTFARQLIDEALTGFAMYEPLKHKNLPTLIDEQIAQVTEYRKVTQ